MNLLLVLKIPKNIDVATNAFKKQMEGGLVKVCTEAIKRKREGEIGISRKRRKRYTKVGDVAVHVSFGLINWRSQNVEKVSHTKGRLLDQAKNLFICVIFQNGNFS